MSIYGIIKRTWWKLPGCVRSRLSKGDYAISLKQNIKAFFRHFATHDEIYDKDFYTSVANWDSRSMDLIARSIVRDCAPSSFLDVGCGTGALLQACLKAGVSQVYGVELSEEALKLCKSKGLRVDQIDLRRASKLPFGKTDFTSCLEVAEHLEPEYAEHLVRLLSVTAPKILFSAAAPGQGGDEHLNEQSRAYWAALFQKQGFRENIKLSRVWCEEWHQGGALNTYFSNAVLYERIYHDT